MQEEFKKYRRPRPKSPIPDEYVALPRINKTEHRAAAKYGDFLRAYQRPAAIRSRPPAYGIVGTRRLENGLAIQRSFKDVRQYHLARAIGISRAALSNIEKGKSVPSVGTALMLAEVLQVTVEDIFYLSND